ncbi:MAG: DUF4321 domain-containing protein [Elusimicrobia bacterium]|nr:DUF4321 domain-containing protein [Elusimicrobiota bacterium]OGR51427.1 MAG: hypothetical protein A2034_00305 [Elusimicrobia bacterium GWA2_38_7]OGR79054.1 MAG: hypothetical protein A3B80_08215 [Elusimicrobia bacterium RIFCSPHIGHO2_02_FULL_39_36]OGR92637.1 MAG: hypothetical protein A3I11_01190 [Elusimicrobia bacterium RIFCSPLOWO2_02_FULL_39_32]OGR99283.1 MAG: hypothetical protein A3G85_06400 [Elusimicrobia bacterium RIFCSPLOWO2_12_FULL_39_28]
MEGKNLFMGIIVIVVGALLGSFIGGFIGHAFPDGIIYDLFSKEISAGLSPTTLDLRVLELTFGCLLKFNVPSVLGILFSAYIFKTFLK